VLNAFPINIGVFYTLWHVLDSISTEKYVRHLKKINVIELKRLYSLFLKFRNQNTLKFHTKTNSNFRSYFKN